MKGFQSHAKIAALLLLTNTAAAAVLPGPVQPEQVSRYIRRETQSNIPGPAAPTITEPKESKTPINEQAQKIKFQLNGIILEGNQVYSDAQLEGLYRDKLHKEITVADLFAIVQSITNFYRNNGYIISRAILPPQHVKGGIVRIRIIEGYLDKVDVTGTPHGAKCLVKAFGCKIVSKRPLELAWMEKNLLLANEIPGTSVKAVLAPSKTEVGAADLTLVTENKPVTGYLSYDNYGTRYIGPQQMSANISFNSFITSGDALQGTLTKTPKGKELTYVDGNYNAALGARGIRWISGITHARTHPLFVLAPLDINGTNDNYYTQFLFPVIRTRSESLTFNAGFIWLDSHVTTLGQELYTDHIRSIGAGGTYNFADRFQGSNLIHGDLRQGLPIFGYTSDTDPATALTSRPGGHAVYTKIAAQLSRLQAIKGPLSLYGLISGQWAFQPLLAAEQFTFGGSQLGRGYDVAELIGDRGLAGSLELRYDWTIEKWYIQSLQPYLFYDAGKIWNIIDDGGIPKALSATSTGIGVRFYFTKYVSGNFMWTKPLTKLVAAEELVGQGSNPRVFFSIVASGY